MIQVHKSSHVNHEVADLIPIACHYDNQTLISKNGELIQILEVKGFVSIENIIKQYSIRDAIRKSIHENINSQDFSVYIQVIRRRSDIAISYNYECEIGNLIEEKWIKLNSLDKQLTNTLYITIIHRGLKGQLKLKKSLNAIIYPLFKKHNFKVLDDCLVKLNNVTNSILADLSVYQSKILTIIEKEGITISEPLSFYYQLLHLEQKYVVLEPCDSSEQLSNADIIYHFNQLEIVKNQNSSIHAAVFTIKYPYNLDVQLTDALLQAGLSFILTETIVLVPSYLALKGLEQHKATYEIAKAKELLDGSKVNDLLAANKGNVNDYCKQQIIFTIFNEDLELFNKKLYLIIGILKENGIVTVREDFNMARTFFAQLPGNIQYLNRESYNATIFAANFSSIHHKNIGGYNGSKWGVPVSIIQTTEGLPYYFNFHNHNNGNTLVIGPQGSGKSSIIRFLTAQASKFSPRIIDLNSEGEKNEFFLLLNGRLASINVDSPSPIQIDIFNLDHFNNDINLLLETLITSVLNTGVIEDTEVIRESVELLVKSNNYQQRIELIENLTKFKHQNSHTAITLLIEFLNSKVYTNLFSKDEYETVLENKKISIDTSECSKKNPEVLLLAGLALMRLPKYLNGEPTIITIKKADFIFTIPVLRKRFKNWLSQLTAKNSITILGYSSKTISQNVDILQEVLPEFATKMIFNDKFAERSIKKALDLTDLELLKLKSHNQSSRIFLLKQGDNSIFARFNLTNAPEILGIIS